MSRWHSTAKEAEIIEWILERNLVRSRHIAKKFGITGQMAGYILRDLIRRGLVQKEDPDRVRRVVYKVL